MTCRTSGLTAALAAALALSMPALAEAPAEPAHAAAAAPARPAAASGSKATDFATPEDGAAALAAAVRASDADALLRTVGPDSGSWLFSGDKVSDRADWKHFLELYDAKHTLDKDGDNRVILSVGADAWPFPAPLVKSAAGWHFDAEAGREEVLHRRVGRNELDTIQTLLAIADAQREYARVDYDKDGFPTYAMKFRSSPGKKDGLYWPTSPGEPLSPLGDLVARASEQGYVKSDETPTPYHGYLFRMLTAQGPAARGGAFDYRVRGKLFGGFAVIAWPAKYANSGIMTFIVNYDGIVYQRDLGEETAARAAKITRYNPDKSWTPAQSTK
jgi:Protein of unknown function (DUF2950)